MYYVGTKQDYAASSWHFIHLYNIYIGTYTYMLPYSTLYYYCFSWLLHKYNIILMQIMMTHIWYKQLGFILL